MDSPDRHYNPEGGEVLEAMRIVRDVERLAAVIACAAGGLC